MTKAGQALSAEVDGPVESPAERPQGVVDEPTNGPVEGQPINEAVLQGRVSADPELKELPSGDRLCTFRLIVPRGSAARGRQTVDTIDCAVWAARVRRTVVGWHAGDLVEVRGAVRRRFFRVATGSASRVELEVAAGRIIRRAGSAS